jgi:hypothetical protein
LRADELAVVAGEAMRTIGANLTVMIDWQGMFRQRARM